MANIRTWINRVTGTRTKRITVRVEHRLCLEECISALVRAYELEDERPEEMSERQILEAVREAYSEYGSGAVWAWSDHRDESEVEELTDWARELILRAMPDFAPDA